MLFMKCMQVILVVITALTPCSFLFAQDSLEISDHAKSTAIVWRLSRELNLTKSQEAEVYDVMMRRWEALSQLNTNRKAPGRKTVMDMTLSELRSVLSAEQLSLFMMLREKRKQVKQAFLSKNPNYRFSEVDEDLDI